jgi:hypothetical protein
VALQGPLLLRVDDAANIKSVPTVESNTPSKTIVPILRRGLSESRPCMYFFWTVISLRLSWKEKERGGGVIVFILLQRWKCRCCFLPLL